MEQEILSHLDAILVSGKTLSGKMSARLDTIAFFLGSLHTAQGAILQ
jgi:hypothetical protein